MQSLSATLWLEQELLPPGILGFGTTASDWIGLDGLFDLIVTNFILKFCLFAFIFCYLSSTRWHFFQSSDLLESLRV